MMERAIELDEDPSTVRARIPPDEVPVHPTKKGKGGDLKRGKGEHLDSIENKRARLGGPACMPDSWRNRDPSSMIMSFDMPAQGDGSMMIFFQANSQLPAFGRYVLECSDQERPHRVLDNPTGDKNLWAPQTASPWDVCKRDEEYKFDTAEKHGECALCKGANWDQIARGKFFLHEHPATATSWDCQPIKDLAEHPGVMKKRKIREQITQCW